MKIICDTRQKAGKHENIDKYFERNGIETEQKALKIGDYMVDGGSVVIDTKADLQEVYGNLIHDHDRFRRECIRAKEAGIRLIILVEQAGVETLEDVKTWENPRIAEYNWALEHGLRVAKAPPISSKRLYGIMKTMSELYNCSWEFCSKRSTGKRIVELLVLRKGGDGEWDIKETKAENS